MTSFGQLFGNPKALGLLGVLAVLGMLAFAAVHWRRRALARFAQAAALRELVVGHRGWRANRTALVATGLLFVILGIAGPQWGRDPNPGLAVGRDVVMVLDMSRSMLADDVVGESSPNRLGRARDALLDLVNAVQARGGHRLGLVVFAAGARVACPLTNDYDHVRQALADLDPTDPLLRPRAVEVLIPSGTRIGQAVRLAIEIHDPRFKGVQDVLLVSDGDDPAGDGEWRSCLAAAREAGMPLYVIGIGDPATGGRIPDKDGYLRHRGNVVLSRLREEPLEELARLTGGVYVPARTRTVDIGNFFARYIAAKPRQDTGEDVVATHQQRYAWFLAPALFLMTVEMLATGWPGRRARRASPGEVRL